MAVWPFSRIAGARKRPRSSTLSDPDVGNINITPILDEIAPKIRSRQKKRRTDFSEPSQLQRRYSFSPDRQESIHVSPRYRRPVPPLSGRSSRPSSRKLSKRPPPSYFIQPDPARPSLIVNRLSNDSSWKSSKRRRREQRAREAEIRALSSSPPGQYYLDESGHLFRKASKNTARHSGHSSDMSIALDDLPSDTECTAYRVTSFGALAPRPTLRRQSSPAADAPHRMSSQRRRLIEKSQLSPSVLKASKRVDDLADDLNASELRELLERDKRRRELRRQKERQRAERHLAELANQQQRQQFEPGTEHSPGPNLQRGVLGRDSIGAVNPPSAVVVDHPEPVVKEDACDVAAPARKQSKRKRLFVLKRSLSITSSAPVNESSHSVAASQKPASSIRSRLSWNNLFFWTSRSRRCSSQSSPSIRQFEHAAYERVQNAPFPSTLSISTPPPSSSQIRMTVVPTPDSIPIAILKPGIPRRNRSRFREDLPELPPSPPRSRPISTDPSASQMFYDDKHLTSEQTSRAPSRGETPLSWNVDLPSMSLASVDSEASWFSSRLSTRRSGALRSLRQGRNTPQDSLMEEDDDTAIIEDAHSSRLTPRPKNRLATPDLASIYDNDDVPRISSDEEGMRWGDVVRHQPTVSQTTLHIQEHQACLKTT